MVANKKNGVPNKVSKKSKAVVENTKPENCPELENLPLDDKKVTVKPQEISLEMLSDAYEKVKHGIDSGDDLTSLEEDFKILTEVDKISEVKGLKLISQLLLQTFENFPHHFDKVVKAICFLINSNDVDVRTTIFANLKIILPKDSSILPSIFKHLLNREPLIENEVEERLLKTLLYHVIQLDPLKYMIETLEVLETAKSSDFEKILKFTKEFDAKFNNLLSLNSSASDAFIGIGEKIIGGFNVQLMYGTLEMLMNIPSVNTLNMRLKLIQRFKTLAKFKEPYKLTSKEDKKRLADIFTIMKCVELLFSKNAPSDIFFNHLLDQVLPFFNSMKNEKKVDYIIKTLKIMAAFSENLAEVSPTTFSSMLNLLKENIPSPSTYENLDESSIFNENLKYTFLEPALMIFYKMSSINQTAFQNATENSEFVLQLQYFARCIQINVQKYGSEISNSESKVMAENPKSLLMAYSMSCNIQILLRDLVKKSPIFTSKINPTWLKSNDQLFKPLKVAKQQILEKEKKVAEEKDKIKRKKEGAIYRPPIGKYSGNSNNRSRLNNKSKHF